MLEEVPEPLPAHRGEHFEVLDANSDRLVLGVASQASDLLDEPAYHVSLSGRQLRDPGLVDGRPRTTCDLPHDLSEETLGGHPVEVRQLTEALERDAPLTALVPGNRRRLETTIRPRPHIAEGHPPGLTSPSECVPSLKQDVRVRNHSPALFAVVPIVPWGRHPIFASFGSTRNTSCDVSPLRGRTWADWLLAPDIP